MYPNPRLRPTRGSSQAYSRKLDPATALKTINEMRAGALVTRMNTIEEFVSKIRMWLWPRHIASLVNSIDGRIVVSLEIETDGGSVKLEDNAWDFPSELLMAQLNLLSDAPFRAPEGTQFR